MAITLITVANILLQSCVAETMRASVVLLFAFLALAFVVTYAADEVSVYGNIAGYLALEVVQCTTGCRLLSLITNAMARNSVY